jgi:hypothetical protein
MADTVNLRIARKRQRQQRAKAEAAENRVAFGTPKAERRLIEAEREKAERDLDSRRIVPSDE